MATASSISPSGHAARRQVRHRRAVDRLDSRPRASRRCRRSGRFAEEAAQPARRRRSTARDWRVLMAWHLAETREQARRRGRATACSAGTTSTTCSVLGRPGAEPVEDPWELLEQIADGGADGCRRGRHRHARRR